MSNVEFVVDDDQIISIFVLGDAPMSASYADGVITVDCDFSFTGITSVSLRSLKKDGNTLNVSEYTLSREGSVITITPSAELEAGEYTLTLKLNNGSSEVTFTVE